MEVCWRAGEDDVWAGNGREGDRAVGAGVGEGVDRGNGTDRILHSFDSSFFYAEFLLGSCPSSATLRWPQR
jgi:hypothetical protein